MSSHARKSRVQADPRRIVLRMEWEGIWDAQDKKWARLHEYCQCTRPVVGPSYLGRTPCKKCGLVVQRVRLRRAS